MLEKGMKAPDFTLKDKNGNDVSLSDFLGKKVVLYFYPRDNTPGCTRQACAFAALYNEFEKRNVEVIGISKDSVSSHIKFIEKYNLPFVLLSDPELSVIKDYGVWQEKKMYGKVSFGVVRTTFIIDENGVVEYFDMTLGATFPRPQRFDDIGPMLIGKKPTEADILAVSKAMADKIIATAGIRHSTKYKYPVAEKLAARVLHRLLPVEG